MLSLRLVVVSAFLMFAIGCSGSDSSPITPSPAPAPAPAPSPTPVPLSSSVTIPVGAETLGNRAYAPDELDIAAGTTVTWMNADTIAHTSTSDAAGWNSGIVAPGGQFSFSFQTAGAFSYHCAIHPGMIGKVVVH
jgi:plastocyanin